MLAVLVEREPELLDGGDDDLVRVVVGFEAADKRRSVGIFLDTILLKAIELLTSLAVKIFTVDNKQALMNILVGLEQRRNLEGGERLTRASRVPDIPVTAVLIDAIDDGLDSVDLIGTHHQKFPVSRDEDHVLADGFAECAFGKKPVGKVVEMRDLDVIRICKLIHREISLVRVEGEVSYVVVREVPGVSTVANDENLDKTEQRADVSVAGITLIFHDLLHRPPRTDSKRLQFDLSDRDAIDQEHDIIAVMAVIGVDADLVDDLEVVLAPILDVDESVIKRRAVVTSERFPMTENACSFVNVGCDDFVEKPPKLAVGELDAVQRFELLPEISFERGPVANIRSVYVLEVLQLGDKGFFKLTFWQTGLHLGTPLSFA